jgi:dCMP deaminase
MLINTEEQHEIDLFYLREAYRVARDFSDDPVAQNGAILVTDNTKASLDNIVAYSANRFPRGVRITEERRNNKSEKLLYINHAERLCIYDALKKHLNTKELIMYCPWITCNECAKTINEFGLKELIGHTGPEKFYQEINKDKIKSGEKKSEWEKSIEAGFNMLDDIDIPYRLVDGKIGDIKITFAGRDFEP